MFKNAIRQASIREIVELFKKPAAEAEDLSFELGRVRAKTMLAWGQDDRAGAFDVALLMLRLLRDGRLYVFPRCGHWAHVELTVSFFSSFTIHRQTKINHNL